MAQLTNTCKDTPPSSLTFDDRICLNVSGRQFLISRGRLRQYPTTLLGSETLEDFYDHDTNEYFFDRNRDTFESIFDFYLFGKLYPPRGIPEDMYLDEVDFFNMMTVFVEDIAAESDPELKHSSENCCQGFMRSIHMALENPGGSIGGKIWGWLDLFFIALSVVAMIVETNVYVKSRIDVSGSTEERISFVIESITVIFFTFDVLLRFTVSNKRVKFVKSPSTWLDIVTVAPYYLELFIDASRFKGFKILRMGRVVRVLKLIKRNKRLILIATVMSNSVGELGLLIIVWLMCVTVAGIVFYYCEFDSNDSVRSGVDGLWWAVVTMSTVGYGDITPNTAIGKLFATAFFYIGMVFLALPLTVIVGDFSKQYENRSTWAVDTSSTDHTDTNGYSMEGSGT